MIERPAWWQRGIIYQVYPRSFQDTNSDGVGDLPGITRRLDYLEWLGVDAIWISPMYPSPMADFGYDVSDYCAVHPLFGTLADFSTLVAEAHQRGIKVILDFVPNHTSDQHPWFIESRSSRTSAKRNWYLWTERPNNWLSVFGGSAWELDPGTGQYYYHAYLKEQPDLNWHNPAVRAAMQDVLRFWFERGVDGMRIDALRQLVKDLAWRDNPPNPVWSTGMDPYSSLLPTFTTDQPEIMDIIRGWRDLSDSFPERVLIGELWLPIDRLVAYYGSDGRALHLPFNFHLILTPWTAATIGALIEQYEAALPGGAWPNWVLGNHDRSRIASRVGVAQARVAAMLLLTLRGTPTLYQGDELGMRDVPIPAELVQDPVERNVPGLGLGRDPERTPMQWDASVHAGFCAPDTQPWLPLAPDFESVNVAVQRDDPTSMLTLYRELIGLRRTLPALSVGSYRTAFVDGAVLAYWREASLIVLNFGGQAQRVAVAGRIVLSTHLDRSGHVEHLDVRPDEGIVLSPD